MAVATSGNYEKYVMIDGQEIILTIWSKTGLPVKGIKKCLTVGLPPMQRLPDAWLLHNYRRCRKADLYITWSTRVNRDWMYYYWRRQYRTSKHKLNRIWSKKQNKKGRSSRYCNFCIHCSCTTVKEIPEKWNWTTGRWLGQPVGSENKMEFQTYREAIRRQWRQDRRRLQLSINFLTNSNQFEWATFTWIRGRYPSLSQLCLYMHGPATDQIRV